MSGRCTFSASHNPLSSRFQDNDDNKNDKKTTGYHEKSTKTRIIPHKKEQKHYTRISCTRVAELGSLSSGAKMAMKIFVKQVFTIFA